MAARGLDIPEVDYVFHASFPRHVDSFVHRTGRTARAGRSGTNIAMITQDNLKMVSQIEKETGISFTRIAYVGSPFLCLFVNIFGEKEGDFDKMNYQSDLCKTAYNYIIILLLYFAPHF